MVNHSITRSLSDQVAKTELLSRVWHTVWSCMSDLSTKPNYFD